MTDKEREEIISDLKRDYLLIPKCREFFGGFFAVIAIFTACTGFSINWVYETAINNAKTAADEILRVSDLNEKTKEIERMHEEALTRIEELRTGPNIIDIINERGEFRIHTEVNAVTVKPKKDGQAMIAPTPEGYTLVSGGVNSPEWRRPIFSSYPTGEGWYGRSSDQELSYTQPLTVYSVGAKVELVSRD